MHQFVVTGTNFFPDLWPFEAFLCLVSGRRGGELIAKRDVFGRCHGGISGGSCSTTSCSVKEDVWSWSEVSATWLSLKLYCSPLESFGYYWSLAWLSPLFQEVGNAL